MKKHKQKNMRVQAADQWLDYQDTRELYAFDGLPMVTPNLIDSLLSQGWDPDLFRQIVSTAPRCEHGKIVAYYCQRRKSILIPITTPDGTDVTLEVSQTSWKVHVLLDVATDALKQLRKSRLC